MLTIREIVEHTGGRLVSFYEELPVRSVSIDTRTLQTGDCFVAIRGEHFDGHCFLPVAKEKGATAYIIDEVFQRRLRCGEFGDLPEVLPRYPNVIAVPSVQESLESLAAYCRSRFRGRTVGITGSCGKTTTKEYVRTVLEDSLTVSANLGNFNNHLGLPLTIINMERECDILVSEIGASALGEIRSLSNILQPHVGIVTNVHPAHLKGFGSLDSIYRAKLELGEYLDTKGGTLIINGDDQKLVQEARLFNCSLITFGRAKTCDIVLTDVEYQDDTIVFEVNGKYRFILRSIARFNVYNALAALALADYFSIPFDKLVPAIARCSSIQGRFSVTPGEYILIDDTYNANPHSFYEALDVLRRLKKRGRKIVVCGDMLELEPESERFHRELGRQIFDIGIDVVVGIGALTKYTIDELESCQKVQKRNQDIELYHCRDTEQARLLVASLVRKNDAVLVKGSRSLRLDELVKVLKMVAHEGSVP